MGHARHGKNLSADIVQSYCENVFGKRVQQGSFAYGLKEEAARLLGHTVEYIEDHKEVFRPFLQWYGTDYIREFRRKATHWVDQLGDKLDAAEADGVDVFLVTDIRFKNEAAYIKGRGGTLVSIFRSSLINTSSHSSELYIPFDLADYSISNNSISQLSRDVASIATKILYK